MDVTEYCVMPETCRACGGCLYPQNACLTAPSAANDLLSEDQLRQAVKRACAEEGSIAEFSRRRDLHPEPSRLFVAGKRPAEPRLLKALGLERVVLYRPKDQPHDH